MEIRFVNSQAIHQFVVNAIRKTLSAALNTRSLPAYETPNESEQAVFRKSPDSEGIQFEFSSPHRKRFSGETRSAQEEALLSEFS